MPIDPSMLVTGPEWSIGGIAGQTAPAGGGSFASVLGQQVGKLSELQTQASDAAQSLAAGTATDPSTAVMAVERARLSMQLAAQIRTKSVEALQDVFHTQV